MMPEADQAAVGADAKSILRSVNTMQQVVLLGRKIRETRGVNLKTPIQSVTVLSSDPVLLDDVVELSAQIVDELNAIEVNVSADVAGIETTVKPNFAALKSRFEDDETVEFGKLIKSLSDALKTISQDQITALSVGESVSFPSVLGGDVAFSPADVLIVRDVSKVKKAHEFLEYGSNAGNAVVVMDFTPKPDLIKTALAREVSNRVQKLRKSAALNQNDPIIVQLHVIQSLPADNEENAAEHTESVLVEKKAYMEGIVKKPVVVGALDTVIPSTTLLAESEEALNEFVKVHVRIWKSQ